MGRQRKSYSAAFKAETNNEDSDKMNPQLARARFLERLEEAGLSLDTLTPTEGIEAMIEY